MADTRKTAEDFIGIDSLYYADCVDTVDGTTYGTPKILAPVAELSKTTNGEPINTYYDDGIYRSLSSESTDEYTITVPQLDLETLADVTGKTIDTTTGALLDSGEPEGRYFAILYRAQLSDYSYRYYAVHKVSFATPDEEATGKTDTIEPKGMELTVTSMRTLHKYDVGGTQRGIKRIIVDARDGKVDVDKWFDAVPVPGSIPVPVPPTPGE